jgi:AcrR family transcriptional regulator
MAVDRRVLRTRARLQDTFVSLIRAKGYDAISVSDICKSAKIGRSTFYAHFTDKDDLKKSGLEHLRRMLIEAQKSGHSADRRSASLGFSLALFEHARDHIDLYRSLAGSRGGAIALGTIQKILSDLVRAELCDPPLEIPREFLVRYTVGAYMAVLTWWLDGGAKLSPRRIDEMFRQIARNGIAAGA